MLKILSCIYVYMYICIYLKRNYVGFDSQWTRYVGGRLKSGSSQFFFLIKMCMELKKVECFDDLK